MTMKQFAHALMIIINFHFSGEAVPCALYAFLHCSSNSFRDLIPYAISLGGDADTIACMAGM